MEHYFGVAKEQGITNDEIGAVQSIVMAVSGGRIRAQFREARIKSKKQPKKKSKYLTQKNPKKINKKKRTNKKSIQSNRKRKTKKR